MINENTFHVDSPFLPEIRKGRVKVLTIHEISETELNTLAQGSPNSVYLNFAICLFTLAASFLISILTTNIDSDRIYMTFITVIILGFLLSAILFFLWKKEYKSVKAVVEEIRKRLPPEGNQKT